MEQHKNIPVIRFKGFQEEWTEKNITDISKVFIGLVTTMTKFYTNSGTLLIRNSDIKNNYFEFAQNPIYLEQKFADQNSSRKLLIGDVVTVHTGDVGTSAVISENEFGAIGFATINTRVNQKIILPYYLSTFLNSSKHKKFAIQNSTGDGRSNYNLKDFFKLYIPLTSIPEQTQIGNFFKTIDEQINLQEQKHQKLVNLKKAMLEKMFPKEGADVPEIRFKGFTEKWEEKKLGDISSQIMSGKDKPIKKGKYPLFGSTGLIGTTKNKTYNTEQILVARVGANAGYVQKVFGLYGVTDNTLIVSLINKSLNSLIYYYLIKINLSKFIFGSGQPLITGSILKDIKIHLSTDENELLLIGNYFEQLDILIQQSQVQIEKYKNIKQALLQKMFV